MCLKIRYWVLSALLVAVLSGCMPQSTKWSLLKAEDRPDRGFAALTVRLNGQELPTGRVTGIENHKTLEVVRIDGAGRDAKTYSVPAWSKVFNGETVFLLNLPPGTYRPEKLSGKESIPGGTIRYGIEFSEDFGTFDIVPGHLAKLGTVVVHLHLEGDYGTAALARTKPSFDVTPLSKDFLDAKLPNLEYKGEIAWNERTPGPDTRQIAERAQKRPHFSGHPVIDSAGRVLIPTFMGSLQVRMPSGDWFRADSGKNITIRSVEETDEGFIVAGSFGNVLRTSSLALSQWEKVPGLEFEHDVMYAGKDSRDRLFAVTVHRDRVINSDSFPSASRYKLDTWITLQSWTPASEEWQQVARKEIASRHIMGDAFRYQDGVALRVGTPKQRGGDYYHVDPEKGEIKDFDDFWAGYVLPHDGKAHLQMDSNDAAVVRDGKALELAGVYHQNAPVKLSDGSWVAFGRVYNIRTNEWVRLPGATAEKYGERVPYDPEDGMFFLGEMGSEEWEPFAVPPENCYEPVHPIAVGDRIIQRCLMGLTFSRTVDDDNWTRERGLTLKPLTHDGEEK